MDAAKLYSAENPFKMPMVNRLVIEGVAKPRAKPDPKPTPICLSGSRLSAGSGGG